MTISILSLLLNILIVGLLMATISYCWVLNKRIKLLQDGKSELANLLQYFDESTTRASETIMALQSASKKIGENIQTRIDKANYLMDDLAFMVEKGNRLADKLEANFAVDRARKRVLSDDNETTESAHNEVSKPVLILEEPISSPKIVEKISSKEKTAASLEAVLDRVIGRTKPNNTTNNNSNNNSSIKANERDNSNRQKPASNTRSKAEQELLDMIRAGIRG